MLDTQGVISISKIYTILINIYKKFENKYQALALLILNCWDHRAPHFPLVYKSKRTILKQPEQLSHLASEYGSAVCSFSSNLSYSSYTCSFCTEIISKAMD